MISNKRTSTIHSTGTKNTDLFQIIILGALGQLKLPYGYFETGENQPPLFWFKLTNSNLKDPLASLVETPDTYRKLHEYMNQDDVEWPSLLRFDWKTKPILAHLIVFYLFGIVCVEHFYLMSRAQ